MTILDKLQDQLDWLFNSTLGELINQFIIYIQETFHSIIFFLADGGEKLYNLRFLDLSFGQTIFTLIVIYIIGLYWKDELKKIDRDKLLNEKIKEFLKTVEENNSKYSIYANIINYEKSALNLSLWIFDELHTKQNVSEKYDEVRLLFQKNNHSETNQILKKIAKQKFFYIKFTWKIIVALIFVFWFFPSVIYFGYLDFYDLTSLNDL